MKRISTNDSGIYEARAFNSEGSDKAAWTVKVSEAVTTSSGSISNSGSIEEEMHVQNYLNRVSKTRRKFLTKRFCGFLLVFDQLGFLF